MAVLQVTASVKYRTGGLLAADHVKDVGELLKIGDEKRKLGLTCPAERGGRCLQFCPSAAVVLRRDGSVSVIYANNLTPEELFGGKVLRLAPDTYFLTPTGRVDVVERKAAVSP